MLTLLFHVWVIPVRSHDDFFISRRRLDLVFFSGWHPCIPPFDAATFWGAVDLLYDQLTLQQIEEVVRCKWSFGFGLGFPICTDGPHHCVRRHHM